MFLSLKDLKNPDVIILPGTKNTVEDFLWLQESGLVQGILQLVQEGVKVVGICGGYQMLGESICESAIERSGGTYMSLGLLPIETHFVSEKQSKQSIR